MPKQIPEYLSRWTGRHTRIASTIPVSLFILLKHCLPADHGNTDSDVIRWACHNAGLLFEKQRELDAEKEKELDERRMKAEESKVEQILNAKPVDREPDRATSDSATWKGMEAEAVEKMQKALQEAQRDRSGD